MNYLKYVGGYLLIVAFLVSVGFSFYEIYKLGYSVLFVSLFAMYSLNLLFVFIVFIQTRHSGAKLAWIMVMALIPVLGHILFVIFGQRYKGRIYIEDYRKKYTFEYEKFNNDVINDVQKANKSLFATQSTISNRGTYKANIDVYQSGGQGYQELFKDLWAAKKFIHIHYYIIKPGEIYEEFKSILLEKQKQGLEIRFIIDDFGRWAMPWYEINTLKSQGIHVGIFGKVHFPFIGSDNGFRTHRKLAIIDGNIVHTGGINIGDEYANLSGKYGLWIDFQARITGQSVRSFSLLFIQDWFKVTNEKLDPIKYLLEKNDGNSAMILIEDSPEIVEPIMQDSIIRMIINAKQVISITTPYFIPTVEILAALRAACLAGIEVNIFIPGRADKKTVLFSTRYYASILQKYGANIYEAKNMLIHSKIGLFDNKYAYFGSANLDIRSLYSQFEMISLVSGEAVGQIVNLFNYYKKLSRLVNQGEFNRSRLSKFGRRFYVNLLSPIM